MTRPTLLIAATLALTGLGRGQTDTRRLELEATLTKQLVAFARSASSQKVHTLARQVAELVIEHYDADSKSARRLLGQRKVRGEWQGDGKALPKDTPGPGGDRPHRGRARIARARAAAEPTRPSPAAAAALTTAWTAALAQPNRTVPRRSSGSQNDPSTQHSCLTASSV